MDGSIIFSQYFILTISHINIFNALLNNGTILTQFLGFGLRPVCGRIRTPAHASLVSKIWWKLSLKQGRTWTCLPQQPRQYGIDGTRWEQEGHTYRCNRCMMRCKRQDQRLFEPANLVPLSWCLTLFLGLHGSLNRCQNSKLILTEPCLGRINVPEWESLSVMQRTGCVRWWQKASISRFLLLQ